MKVLLIGEKNDFKGEIEKVTGIGRYARELLIGLREKVEVSALPLYDHSSLYSSLGSIIKGIFYDYSKYDIIHLIAPKPFFPLRKGNAVWVTTVHDLFFLKYKESKPICLLWRNFTLRVY
ncbi:glycosyltransferase family protein [Saccharolobus islandicus]|uniref:hypothetical protein n=1 Tax=Saccharolobus islandicus TaxID=43080 RepID=UPI000363F000|nr:hypothetical protein [Sulfolobus islandicus]